MTESPAPYMPRRIIVGIDPGQHTGVAVYDADDRRFLSLDTLTFWGAVDKVETIWEYYRDAVRVRIEDPNLIDRIIYRRLDKEEESGRREKIAAGIGKNRRDAQLWCEWLEERGIEFERVEPVRSKAKAGYFKALTRWQGRTNEHQRDAGMLVWGR